MVTKDNILKVGVGFDGLKPFVPAFGEGLWTASNWEKWPRLSLAQGQAGDGLSAVHALKYKKGVLAGICSRTELVANQLGETHSRM